MIYSVGVDFHRNQHKARCLDDRAQPFDSSSFQTTPEGQVSPSCGTKMFRIGKS